MGLPISPFVGVRVNGKYRRVTIGQYDEKGLAGVSLKEAREQAYQIAADAHAGVGPEVRKKREEKGTFGAVAAAFMQELKRADEAGSYPIHPSSLALSLATFQARA
jgi:hypothetical protein